MTADRPATTMTAEEHALWGSYRQAGSLETRNALMERYLGLVHHVAHRVHRSTLGQHEDLEDLIGAGHFGLLQAIAGFDPGRGLQFSTYAVQRIHGAILDDIRARDWAPRSVRATGRQVEAARRRLEDAGTAPTTPALAAATGLSPEALHRHALATAQAAVHSLEGLVEAGAPIADVAPEVPSALDRVLSQEQRSQIQAALAQLPAQERTVLMLHYYEDLSFRQIAAILFKHETRISQLHASARRRLRELLTPLAS